MVLADSYQVTSAFTGEQGIEIVRDENPDVVLLDIILPDIDGLKVLETLMAIPAPPQVVMLTGIPYLQGICMVRLHLNTTKQAGAVCIERTGLFAALVWKPVLYVGEKHGYGFPYCCGWKAYHSGTGRRAPHRRGELFIVQRAVQSRIAQKQ
jgi:CheY-like chemotaxis protein